MQNHFNISTGEFHISTDRSKLDLALIHDYLSNVSYWSPGIPYETVQKAADNSLNFGLFHGKQQVGYARIVTDYCQIAYLGDVFILEAYQGQGLGKWLMKAVHTHPDLQNLRNWLLGTKDAHDLYRKFGWENPAEPTRWMVRVDPDVYKKQ